MIRDQSRRIEVEGGEKAAAVVFYERYVAGRQHPEYLRLKQEHRARYEGK